jgi:hypothetical protein
MDVSSPWGLAYEDEVLKHILADGGFKIFAKECGHKGDVTQWQDIHNILVLVACHESITRAAILEFSKLGKQITSDSFCQWLNDRSKQNKNSICKFWSQFLIYLHACMHTQASISLSDLVTGYCATLV